MGVKNSPKLRLVIGIVLLLGVLGVGVLSLGTMDHGVPVHQGCIGLSTGTAPCVGLADAASCLRVHLEVLQGIAQAIPGNVSQLLVLFVVATVLWFGFKRKRGEPDALSRLRFRLRHIAVPSVLLSKLGQWLTLHEKRDPAPATLVVFGLLPVPIM